MSWTSCKRARDLLSGPGTASGADPALARHLASCADCERFAARWAAVRGALAARRANVTPDAGFAARVTARLGERPDPFAWAARRLLPVTLGLTLALGGWCLLRTPAPPSLAAELADGDLMTWVAHGAEEER